MFSFLKQPSPLPLDTRYALKVSSIVGLFVFFFLVVFQPFGLSTVRSDLKYYLIGGYTVVCFAVLLLSFLLVPRLVPGLFNEERWTVYKRILWQLWLVFSVGTGNYLFACLFNAVFDFYRPGFGFFLYIQLVTVSIAIIPIVVINLLSQNLLLRRNLKFSEEISAKLKTRDSLPDSMSTHGHVIILTSENEKDRYELLAEDILYACSEGNYTRVFVMKNRMENIFIRSSLKRVEKKLTGLPFLFRCHRAYIVNIRKVKKATGNAQGLALQLENTEKTIPVARGYVRVFRQRLGIG